MKHNCALVQDLLPLYHDDVCSAESRRVVNEHLEECESCRAMLNDLDIEMLPKLEEAKPMASIRGKWNKEKKKVFIRALALTMVFSIILIAGIFALSEWPCIPLDKNDVVLTDIYETSDGTIHFTYKVLASRPMKIEIFQGENGESYLCHYRTLFAKETSYTTGYFFFSVDPNNQPFPDRDECPIVSEKLYLESKDDPEHSILVWEKGMDIRPATAEEESTWNTTLKLNS